jgi:predicted MPP superfamily phosphohydrolase
MAFQLREVNLPILPKGSPELRVLHFSDLHLTPRRKREIQDIRSWSELNPDLVISTGDFLGHKDAIDTALYALEPLLDLPGLYVFGSNDYYGPRFKNPLSYLKKDDGTRILGERLRTEDLDARLQARGWKNLKTAKLKIEVKGIVIEARGTDDAHLELDDYSEVAGARDKKVDLSIGLTHAPYKRIIDSMAADKLDLIFAGHTHGGQVRVPWFGGTRSLTTNCDLPNWRSRGLTQLGNEPYLHVSAGMGQSKFAPIRFLCETEKTILCISEKGNVKP